MATLKLKGGTSVLQNIGIAGKVAIGLVFMVLIGAGYYIVFYGEVNDSIEQETGKVTTAETDLAGAKEAREAYNKDLAELKRREGLVNKQKTILPDDAETPAFLSTLQTVATISGVNLTSWTPQDEVFEEFYAKIPMQLTIKGKFHQVARFFYGIGQADRIINMENITIQIRASGAEKKPAGPQQQVQLSESATVDVQCLATAFRALTLEEGKRDRKGGKGKPGQPAGGGGK